MQSLLLSVKRLRHVLIIFFKPEIICFLGGRAWGKEQVEEICTIFVEEKDLSWLHIIVYKNKFLAYLYEADKASSPFEIVFSQYLCGFSLLYDFLKKAGYLETLPKTGAA